MSISRETVLHVARLARLELSDEEVARFEGELGKILSYVEELSALDVEGVPETAQVAAALAPLRDDTHVPGLDPEIALREAPRRVGSGFAVPAFVDD